MALQNLFDMGPCAVVVTNAFGDGTEYFRGVLSKGQTSAVFHGYNFAGIGEEMTCTVNSDGSVQTDNVAGGISNGYVLAVEPQFTIQPSSAQISAMALYEVDSGAKASAMGDDQDDVTLTAASGTSVTPDPAVFSPSPTHFSGLSVFQGAAV